MRRKLKQGIRLVLAGILAGTFTMAAPANHAEAVINTAPMQVLANMADRYSAYRKFWLAMGNNPILQYQFYMDAQAETAREGKADLRAQILVDDVMKQLLAKGDYVLRNNSLPFMWMVVPCHEFNANCNPTDFIEVYDGLVQGCHYNREEVAAVLGHEITHGVDQHLANEKALKALTSLGIKNLVQVIDKHNWGPGSSLAEQYLRFLSVKNIDVKMELKADENGFYTLASAGFNPGGTCAMLTRAKYYTEHVNQVQDFFNPSDHPATERRLREAAKLLHAYGVGHAGVRNTNKVYFDDKFLLEAKADNGLDAEEMAWLIAGGLAKGFHDHETAAGWNFRQNDRGKWDFLNDDIVYEPLKKRIQNLQMADELRQLVETAYANDRKNGARQHLLAKEKKRWADNEAFRQKLAREKKDSADKALNGRLYWQLGLADYAEIEYQRAQKLDSENLQAVCGMALVLSGRGEQEKALAMADKAIRMNPGLGSSYTVRAAIYKNMHEEQKALYDCKRALAQKEKDTYAYKLAGDIYDSRNDHHNALILYRYYKKYNKNANDIPKAYQKEMPTGY